MVMGVSPGLDSVRVCLVVSMISRGARSVEGISLGARILAFGSVNISLLGCAIAWETTLMRGTGRTNPSEPSGSHRSVGVGLKLDVAQPVMTRMIAPETNLNILRSRPRVLHVLVSFCRIVFLSFEAPSSRVRAVRIGSFVKMRCLKSWIEEFLGNKGRLFS